MSQTPNIEAVWPLTALQRALTAHAGLVADGHDPYVGQTLVELRGPLDAPAIERALGALLVEHPNLRAGFAVDDDLDPVQFVPAPGAVEVSWYDAPRAVGEGADDSALHDAVEAAATAERTLPFDPADPPLVRFAIVALAPEHHVLVVTSHHLVLDGWSVPVLVREVARLYGHEVGAGAAHGPAPARGRFADHLVWLGQQDPHTARTHWREMLADVEPSPWPAATAWADAGTASEAPHPQPHDGGATTVRGTLAASAAETVAAGARRQGVTSAALVRVAWGIVVGAHAGTTSATFAVPVAVRSPEVPHADEIVGMLTETVVGRVDAPAAATLGQVLAAHTARWNASWAHQHVGLHGIQAAVGPQMPVATTLVSFEQAPSDAVRVPSPDGGPLTLRVVATRDATHFPLALAVEARDDGWRLELDVHPEALDATGAQALLATFERTLLALAATPEARVASLVLAAPPAVAATAVEAGLADGAGGPDAPPLVTDVLAASIERDPQACALVVQKQRWTFAELDLAVTRAERRLVACGARPGDALAVDLPRDERIVHVILAALRRGLAVTPLPHGAADRRAQVLRLSGARFVWDDGGPRPLGDAHRAPEAAGAGAGSTDAARTDAACTGSSPVPELPAAPDAATLRACVGSIIFTSGSTGEPKGVAVGQDALAHLLDRHRTELYPPGERLRVAHTAAFSFDAHYDAFLALAAGHELHVLDEDVFLDPVALRDYVGEHAIDYLDFTPTVWSALLAGAQWAALPRICVAGGEAFGPALWTRMRELAARTGARVVNLYGPTEATVDALAADVADTAEPVVGHPVGRTRAVVLDVALREVPAGTVGELYLAGPQLAEAYVGRAALTASRFVAYPGGAPGERMYRTGDLARRGEDGTLSLLGRNDDQISLHGFRIEPGEVEAVLVTLDGVAEAAVVLAEHPRWGERLVAYVTASHDGPDVAALHAGAAERLARHLVPTAFVVLDALPLTRHGKLDRHALPAPVWGAAPGSAPGAGHEAVTPLEAQVRAAAARVLGEDALGLDDSFFAVGGDSIDALQLVAALRREGLTLAPADLFAARTPREMARRVRVGTTADEATGDGPAPAGRRGTPGDRDTVLVPLTPAQADAFDAHVRAVVPGATRVADVLPLTPAQLGMVAEGARDAVDPYRTTTRFTIRGLTGDGPALVAEAVQALLRHHPVLRGGVLQLDLPAPVLVVPDRAVAPVEVHDGRGLAPGDLADLIDRADRAARSRPVDLTRAPLVTATVVQGTDELVLVLAMHHLLTDGWSVPLLAADLRTTLASASSSTSGSAPASASEPGEGAPPSFRDYLVWLRDAQRRRDDVEARWRAELAGVDTPSLLADYHGTAVDGTPGSDGYDAGTREVAVVPVDAAVVRAAARRAEVTPATVVQTAWGVVVAALTGQADVLVGSTVAGRPTDLDGVEDVVGMFLATSPLRVPVGAHGSGEALLGDVQRRQARLLDAHHVGLTAIARLAGHRLFDTLVVVESYPRGVAAEQPGPVEVVATGGYDATHYPVTVTVLPEPGGALARHEGEPGLRIEVETRPGALDPAVAAVLPGALAAAIEALASGGALPAPHDLVGPVRVLACPGADGADGADGAGGTAERQAGAVDDASRGARADSARADDARNGDPDAGTARTERVRRVLAHVLGTDVAPTTDFFAAGGDSITAMQVVGALRGAGLVVTVGAVFTARTAARIAQVAAPVEPVGSPAARPAGMAGASDGSGVADERGAATGTVLAEAGDLPLLPALAWLAEAGGDPRGFVQVRVLRTPVDLDADTLRAALGRLVAAHGALRLTFRDGRATIAAATPGAGRGTDILRLADGRGFDEAVRAAAAEIDPAAGRVLRAAWDRDGRRLALVAHHVAVDAVSWRIVVDDLRTAATGGSLPAASAPLRAVATAVHAEAAHRSGEAAAWLDVHAGSAATLTSRPLDPVLDTVATAREHVVRLGADDTRLVLALAPAHRTDHVLLAALAGAAAEAVPGANDLVVEVEGHGRRLDGAGPDLSRTVGWFTTTWPVRLSAVPVADATARLRATARQVAAVPGDGRGYGLLRYLEPTTSHALRDAARECPPQVLVNYLGRETAGTEDWGSVDDAAQVESSLSLHADLPVSHPAEVNAYVVDGPHGPELVARWLLAPAVDDVVGAALVEAWVRRLRDLVRRAHQGLDHPAAGSVAPAPEPQGTPWPLTPVQRGMILHALAAPVDRYVSVVDVGLDGPLDVRILRAAAADVLAAHPQLRLAVVAHGPEDLGLVVTDATEVPLREIALPAELAADPVAVRRTLDDLMADELDTPFDLAYAPLLRLVVVSAGAGHHRLVVTNHHVLLDGWSVPMLVDALLGAYARRAGTDDAASRAVPSAPAPAAAWQLARRLARGDAAAVEVWRDALAGVRPVRVAEPEDTGERPAVLHAAPPGLGTRLARAASRDHVTTADIVTAAWGTVLAAATAAHDVVTGTVVAGRPADVEGAHETLGMFVNTVPVRVPVGRFAPVTQAAPDVAPGATFGDLVRDVHARQARLRDVDHVALADVQRELGVGELFDTLLVVENYPRDPDAQPGAAAGLRVSDVHGDDRTSYPLALTVDVSAELSLQLDHLTSVPPARAQAVLAAVVEVLEQYAGAEPAAVADVLVRLADRYPALRGIPTEPSSSPDDPTVGVVPTAGAGFVGDAASSGTTTVSAGSPLAVVREVFAQTLGAPAAGDHDNFFALGGDSIVAMRLVAALRDQGWTVDPRSVFAAPTPASLALRARPVTGPAPAAAAAPPPAPLVALDVDELADLDDLMRNLT